MNVIVALDLVLALLARAQEVSALIRSAKADGRDSLSPEEAASIVDEAKQAHSALQAAIDKARAEQ